LKFAEDQRFLWDGLLRGRSLFTATDSSFTTYLDKIAGRNVVDVRGGTSHRVRMGVNYTEAVVHRRMSSRITRHHLHQPANCWPLSQEGAIAVGSDADITIIDPRKSRRRSRMADCTCGL